MNELQEFFENYRVFFSFRDASEDWHRFIHRDSDVMMKVLMDFMKDVIDKYS